MTLHGRDFLKEADFTPDELDELLLLAARLKAARRAGTEQQYLTGKQLALIFEKTSTRTRISFEVAMRDQGGHVTVLDPASSQVGHKESIADTARVLSRIFDAIEYRGALALDRRGACPALPDVPVYNGLTDRWHPTQMLADFLTMREHAADATAPLRYAYVGDARYNMGNSLLVMGALMGVGRAHRGTARAVAGPGGAGPGSCDGRSDRGHADDHRGRGLRVCRARSSSTPTSGSPWASLRMSGRGVWHCSRPTASTRP